MNPYETDTLVAQYLDFQYGPNHFRVANYAEALAGLASELCGRHDRALDIGCATGRASFELARRFAHVDGVDYSARFIDVAPDPGKTGQLPLRGAGGRGSGGILRGAPLPPRARSRAERAGPLQPGDACNLKPKYGDYDLVLASNLIDRLREPARFLRDIAPRLRSGGLLVLTSPYTWLTDYTPRPTGSAASGKTARPSAPIRRCNGCWRRSSRSTCPRGTSLRHPRDRPQVPAHGGPAHRLAQTLTTR